MKRKLLGVLLLLSLFMVPWETQAAIVILEAHTNVNCNGFATGAVDITPGGGTAPYTYNWSDGTITEDRAGLSAGNYWLTVTDNLGASNSILIFISEPTPMTTLKSITHVYCGGGNTGAIDLTVLGGSPGYTYAWSDFVYTEDRANLTAANYYVTITDSKGCTKVDSANVTQPPGMVINKTITNVTCGSGVNGAIDLTVQFGFPAYLFSWCDGAITEDRTAIAAGTYTVTVTDITGCSVSASATVGQSGAGMAVNTSSVNPSCFGGANGTTTVISVIGSVGPYTFRWSDGPTTQNRTGMGAGSYTVTATSTTGCTAAATVNLTSPTQLNITLNPIQLTCFGSNNGAINTIVTGGTSPYSYNWGDGIFTQNRTGLATGNYTVTVTDFRGCTATQTTFVPQPLQLTITAVPLPQACIGGPTGSVTTTVVGGMGSYSYWWGAGVISANQNNVNAGNYCVTVTDANGCSTTACATVPAYTPMNLTSTQVNNLCYGAATGSVDLSVANGWSPFTYVWSNSPTTQNISSLATGSYTVTVSDNHSCTATRTVTITQPAFAITINSTVTDVTCNGGSNGAINLSVSNGVAPYTYNWGGGVVTQNRTGLSAGNYGVTVTDNNSCTVSTSITVNQPTPILITPTVTNATCFGASTGAINLAVTGSFAPYAYNWGGGIITQNRTGLAQGTYPVSVTDNHSCTASASIAVSQPAAITISPTVVNLTCNNISTGSINSTVAGGTSPYAYNWGGGVITQNRTALAAGSYTVTVTDNAGCSTSNTSVVIQPTAIVVSSVNTNVSCNAGNNGAINLSVSGGTSPYTFNWGGGIITQNRASLTAATYNVTVTDNASCTATYSTAITQPATLSASAVVTNVSCNGGNNGAINITVSGGTSPYSFNWGGGVITQNRAGLAQGTYSVTVTDNAGCSAINSSTVNQPGAITVTPTATNASCFGGSNGAINMGVSGGNSPYTFNWGGGITTQNRTGLMAGTYIVTVTDNTGCSMTSSATVSQGSAITVTPTVINATCFGGNNGAINISVSGGASPYSFNWGGGVVSQNRTALTAGSYTLTVTDNALCTASNTSTVNQASAISVASVTTNVACNGGSTGSINLTVSGGAFPYTFNWGGGVITQNRTGLTSGNYTVTVTDNATCTTTHTATISQTTSLSVSSTQTNVVCFGGTTGAINTTVTGGTTPYSYSWGGGIITPNRTGLAAGAYTITVSDNVGCTVANTTTITEPAVISIVPAMTDVACAGGNTGAINLTVSGGTSPYTFNWGGGVVTQNRTGLAQGTYSVTVTDNAGCTRNSTSTVAQNASLSITSVNTNATCNGGSNGTITLTSNGGTTPYYYNWGGGIITQNRTGLAAGNYTVTVIDNAGCSGSLLSTVTQPAALIASAVVTNISCNGGSNGSINIVTSGGTSPYAYNWGGGVITQNRTNLPVGSYNVTITDNNSCTVSTAASVTEPAVISLSATPTNVTCYGASTGSIALTVTGGTSAYTFNWSNGPATQNNNSIPAGNYSVSVTDANLCTANTSTVITQGTQITTSTSVVNTTCFGSANGSIDLTVGGGVGSYTYNWSNLATTQDISNIVANTYNVTVKDAANCTALATATISQPTQIVLSNTHVNVLCNGGNTGSIDLSVTGGTSGYTYNWSTGATAQDVSVLVAQNYTVTVNDNNSCSATATVAISQPAILVVAETHTNVSCNGGSNATINTTPSGGVSPYSFNWGNSVITQNRTGLTSGSYVVTVTDANACSTSLTSAITQPAALTLTTTKTDVTCAGAATGTIDLSVTGGTTNYLYQWNNNILTQDLSGVSAGTYSVIVTDANACIATTSATITQPTPITVSFTQTNVTCFGGSNGSITTTATGGNGSYQFVWSNSGTAPSISNLTAGNYSLSLTDATNCATMLSFNITQPSAIAVLETHQNVHCNGANDGSIDLSVNGAAFPYTYIWSNNAVTQDVTSLAPGLYSVTVTDANLCATALNSVSISEPVLISLSTVATDVTCNGAATGAVNLTVTGGTAPYSYSWTGGNVTQDVANLSAGNYLVTVTDARGCVASTGAAINQLPSINTTIQTTAVTCYGGNNGAISVQVQGGTAPYNYNWNSGGMNASLSNLTAANYRVLITDANNCSVVDSADIIQPSPIVISATANNVTCYGLADGSVNITVTGGVPAYTFYWNNSAQGASIANLQRGYYTVTITDAHLCTAASGDIVVNEPQQLNIASVITPVGCTGHADGSVVLQVTGGNSPFSYHWSNNASASSITNVAEGSYDITITDINGCIASGGYIIGTTAPLVITPVVHNSACAEVQNGAIDLTVTGGTVAFNFDWNTGDIAEDLNNLSPGTYAVTVTDSRNCSVQGSYSIISGYELTVDAGVSSTINLGETIQLTAVTNVEHNNVYSWSPAYSLSCGNCASTEASPLSNTFYTVNVVDANGCKASDTVSINVNSVTDIFIPNVFTPNNDGNNDLFQLFGDVNTIQFLEFAIFNRWGEKVFETSNHKFTWDGTYKGEAAPQGVYIYTAKIVFINGYSRNDMKGSLTIIR